MGTQSLFWFVVYASLGAALVFIGLLLEQLAEKKKYKNVRHFRHCKWRKVFGEWFVIIGVFIEAVTGGFLAIDEWLISPLNQSVRNMSAILELNTDQTYSSDLSFRHPILGGSFSGISMMTFCGENEISNIVKNLSEGRFVENIRSPALCLFANSYTRFGASKFGASKNNKPIFIYTMDFYWPDELNLFSLKSLKVGSKTRETYNDIRYLLIGIDFLPQNAHINDGIIDLTINQTHKAFHFIHPKIIFWQSTNTDDFITFIIASDSTNNPNFNLNLH